KPGAKCRPRLRHFRDPSAGIRGLHDQMEIVGFDDLPPLFVLNAEQAVFDAVDRPVLASVACPDVDVLDAVELGAISDEPGEQSLVDVDRAGVDEILVAGVDLPPDANIPKPQENDR